ncbi:hypothetical protein KBTX_03917 [wastewater metagenome]|uniref:Uncharacterized protein n=2 Tax=unclassified sequences TaxID=12908 RepID=A0A5B8REU5_9ZZZZ|nr:hypothetical protein KBTEX_03917 [uncultured organism]
MKRLNAALKRCWSRCTLAPAPVLAPLRVCPRWAGRITSASTSEIAKTVPTTAGITAQIWPKVPGMKASGRNATILVSTLIAMGTAMSRAPCTAEGSRPRPRCRYS